MMNGLIYLAKAEISMKQHDIKNEGGIVTSEILKGFSAE